MAPRKSKKEDKNGYWQGQVDTLLNGLKEDVTDIKETVTNYSHDNTKEHQAIQESITSLKLKAAKWGGIAGILGSIAAFLATWLIPYLFGLK